MFRSKDKKKNGLPVSHGRVEDVIVECHFLDDVEKMTDEIPRLTLSVKNKSLYHIEVEIHDEESINEILRLNDISTGIKVGQKLIVPTFEHIVTKDDTISSIAKMHGISVDKLIE